MSLHLLATSAVVYDFIVQGTITADILSDPGLRTTKEDFLACRHAEVLFYCPTSASADAVFIGVLDSLSLKLYCSGWLWCEVVKHTVDPRYFVGNTLCDMTH